VERARDIVAIIGEGEAGRLRGARRGPQEGQAQEGTQGSRETRGRGKASRKVKETESGKDGREPRGGVGGAKGGNMPIEGPKDRRRGAATTKVRQVIECRA
jgi:hypothetical protein